MSPIKRQRLFGPDLEPIEVITFEQPMSSEELRKEYVRGNITVEELDQMLPVVLAREEKTSRTIARHIPQEEGHEVESAARVVGGVVLASVAVTIFLVIIFIALLGAAGFVAHLVGSV